MRYIYRVEGHLSFPFDMLRYDSCWPVRGTDVENLQGREKRLVLLRSNKRPTVDRWASFGWYVDMVSPLDMEGEE